MKTLFLLPILLLSLISTSCWSETTDSAVIREGLVYKKFSDTPFTGNAIGKLTGYARNGIQEGEWSIYYNSGDLWKKGSYKNGKEEGEWTFFDERGYLKKKGSYKNGKEEGEWMDVYWWTETVGGQSVRMKKEFRQNWQNGKTKGRRKKIKD